MPSRRTYLAGFGATLAGLAGCLNATRPGTTETDTTTHTTGRTTTTDDLTVPKLLSWGEPGTVDGTSVAPVDASVQHSAFYRLTPDTFGVVSFEDRHGLFVTLDVTGDGPRPDPGDFALTVDGSEGGWTRYGGVPGERFRRGAPYTYGSDDPGWVGFDTPAPADVGTARVRVQFGGESEGALRWSLPETVRAALERPAPAFETKSFHAPEAVSPGDPVTVTGTAVNRGDGPGVFRAAVNQTGPMYRPETVAFPLDAGESREWSIVVASSTEGVDSISYSVYTPGFSTNGTVEVRSSTTTTSA